MDSLNEPYLAWRRASHGLPARPVGRLSLHAGRFAVLDGEPGLAEEVAALQQAAYLPLTLRKEIDGHREVSLRRLTPGEPDYPLALAEALDRRLGVVLLREAEGPVRP